MNVSDFRMPDILDHMAVKARDYITTDPNASMVKQGMMLEYLCRGYLDEEGLMDRVSVAGRNPGKPTLEDMLDYLYGEGVIPDDRVNRVVCNAVRRNRNRAVHEFFDSGVAANSTFDPLCRICRAVHLSAFSFDPEGGEEVAEPEAVYNHAGGLSRAARFSSFMKRMRMATDDEVDAILKAMG